MKPYKRYSGNEKTKLSNPYASEVQYKERNFTEITELSIKSPRTGVWFIIDQNSFHFLQEDTRNKIIKACQRHERKCIRYCAETEAGVNPYTWKESHPLVVALIADDFSNINLAWVEMAKI